MVSIAKWLFFILTAQIIAVLVFLAVRDDPFTSFIGAVTRDMISQGSNSTFPRNSSEKIRETSDHTQLLVNETKDGTFINGNDNPNSFQSVDNKEAWMYSAFFDHMTEQQGKPVVRLIGVALKDYQKTIYCNFTTEDKNFTSTGHIGGLPESHGMRYLACYAECLLPSNVRPTHVSISFQANQEPTNRFPILYPGPRIRNFTVCYSVLFGQSKMSSQLIQAIEMNRVLGADHFFMYNYSITAELDQILQRYQQDGIVTILQWPLPTLESHYFGQLAALNDCFHRNRNTSRFVVAVDTDEYIIPRNHTNWMELIYKVSPQEIDVSQIINSSQPVKNGGTLTGCFLVVSSFFSCDKKPDWSTLPLQFPFTEEQKTNIMKYNLLTLSQFWREKRIFPPNDRSKCIVRPEYIYITGIHFVHQFNNANKCLHIDQNVALLHHYRISNLKTNIVQETNILKFKDTVYPRYTEQLKKFPTIFP